MKSLVTALAARMRRPFAFVLLPLSAMPLVLIVPLVVNAHANYMRYYNSPPFPAPASVLSSAQLAQFTPPPAFTGRIPVLVYHGINSANDGYSVSQRSFAAQMEMLKAAGFRTISIAQYARFRHGDSSSLPARPILITFDGGRLDAYRGADQILAADGFRATMFVVTGEIESKNPAYLDWPELKTMLASGRWDVQPNAYRGDTLIPVNDHGGTAPFYAMRRYLRSTGEETFAGYQRRVGLDLFTLAQQFANQGVDVHALAVPFSDYGEQEAGNDPRIVPFTLGLMRSQFGTVFVQDDQNDPPYTTVSDQPQRRWEAHSSTTPVQLYQWLTANDPSSPSGVAGVASSQTYANHKSER